MAVIVPFRAIRPRKPFVKDVASYPYDVLNAEEAGRLARANPSSFLHVEKAEVDVPDFEGINDARIYASARKRLEAMKDRPRRFEIKEKEIVIPFGGDMDQLLDDVRLLQELLQAGWEISAAEKGIETVKDLMLWEDNHSNKVGIDEVRKRLLENDILTAAALQERG